MHTRTSVLSLLFLAFALLARTCAADPVGELAAFSSFKNVDLARLAKGEVMVTRGPTMTFPRGLAVESCYLVPASLEKTIALHGGWNPANHPELKVYLHAELPSKPTPGNFKKIESAPGNAAVRSLIDAMGKLNPDKPGLYMSTAEAKSFPKTASGSNSGAILSEAWGNLLYQRASAFASGGVAKQPPYNLDGEAIRASDEIARLLKETGKIRAQFSTLVDALNGSSSKAASYWEFFDVEGQAAFSLGATYNRPGASNWQAVDLQDHASGGYYVYLTFYQGWPVTVNGQAATLVWRGDLLSSPTLGQLRGVERMGSGSIMMKSVQRGVRAFLKDASASH